MFYLEVKKKKGHLFWESGMCLRFVGVVCAGLCGYSALEPHATHLIKMIMSEMPLIDPVKSVRLPERRFSGFPLIPKCGESFEPKKARRNYGYTIPLYNAYLFWQLLCTLELGEGRV